jgi:hypothetical protein
LVLAGESKKRYESAMKRRITYIDGIPMKAGERGEMTAAIFWFGGKLVVLFGMGLGMYWLMQFIGGLFGL